MLADVDGLRAEVRGHVRHQGHIADLRRLAELHTVHRLIGAVVDIGRFRIQLPLLHCRDRGELGLLRVANLLRGAVLCALLVRLLAPLPGDDVVRFPLGAEHVQRNARELESGPSLRKDDLVVVRHSEDVAQVLLGLVGNGHELLGAVGHLHDAHAAALVINELLLNLLEDLQGHLARARREVVDTAGRHIRKGNMTGTRTAC
mmetsp:Transcript_133176/g.284699  ORF Transcript_133176/g.284699 Transcript_133176/m.284699 type:complete len:203 (-) Transcript_133176:27-635(-)